MPLTQNEEAWLREYESLPDEELVLLSEYSGPGIDSPNRAALARYVLAKRNALIRDGRKERTFAIAKEALDAAKEANSISNREVIAVAKQVRWAKWSAVLAIFGALMSNIKEILSFLFS